VKRELGNGSRIEQAVAVPSDVTACGFVGGCPPEPSSGAPRPVWFVTAYEDEGVIAPPTYLLIEDATGKVIARREGLSAKARHSRGARGTFLNTGPDRGTFLNARPGRRRAAVSFRSWRLAQMRTSASSMSTTASALSL
jgi:hypothetical protein